MCKMAQDMIVVVRVHSFMMLSCYLHCSFYRQKTRADRMVAALTSIGPAVFNGGISTLIAIIMLISSQSHVFISYFKVSFVNIFFCFQEVHIVVQHNWRFKDRFVGIMVTILVGNSEHVAHAGRQKGIFYINEIVPVCDI